MKLTLLLASIVLCGCKPEVSNVPTGRDVSKIAFAAGFARGIEFMETNTVHPLTVKYMEQVEQEQAAEIFK